MRHLARSTIVLSLAALLLAACQGDPGPAQRAGKSIDQAGQNVKDAVDPGPAQRAGRAIDNATGQ